MFLIGGSSMTTATTLHLPTFLTATDEFLMSEIGKIAIQTVAGAVAGYVLGIVSPIGGAIFGAVYSTSRLVGKMVINALPIQNEEAKTALRIVAFVFSLGLGVSATAFVGF